MGDSFPVPGYQVRRRGGLIKGSFLAILAAAGLGFAGVAGAQSAAQTAVDAAKKICAGKTITIVWEAGLQSLDPLNFSGPKWEQLTGCKIKVVEVPTAEMFTKIMQEYRAGTGAYDALNVDPGMDARPRAGRRARAARHATSTSTSFRDELKTDRADISRQPDDRQREDLRLPRRRRRVPHVLPQGHLRAPRSAKGVQGEVQLRPRAAQDLEAVRPGRQLPDRRAEERRHLRRAASSASRPTPCSCSRSASATRAASSSTPAP